MYQKKIKALPDAMVHRAVPFSVPVALDHMPANAVKAAAGSHSGYMHASLSHSIPRSQAPDKKAVVTIFMYFCITRPRLEPSTSRL